MNLNYLPRNRWHGGQLLAFSALDGPTDFFDGLTARTASDEPGIDIMLPGMCLIRFEQEPGTPTLVTSDSFEFQESERTVRGVFIDAHHLLVEGSGSVGFCDPTITVQQEGNRTLIGSTTHFDPTKIGLAHDTLFAERKSWLNTLNVPAGLPEHSSTALAKALSMMKGQVCSPEGGIHHRWTTPDRWPHRGLWLWDSVFHAAGWRHVDIELAREMICAVLDAQREDGFVPHAIRPDGTSDITQPPILAWGVKLVNEIEPDLEWMKALYPKLCAYVNWDLANRDSNGDGLVEWFIEADENCRSGESGMDNSPRFDTATQLDAVDFNAFLAQECEVLSEFAAQLGREAEATAWTAKHVNLNRLINERLWSDELQFYVDYDVDADKPSTVMASSGFLPLLCGAASPAQAAALAAHVTDPHTFGTRLPIPSVSVTPPEHYAKDMWRGPVWVNLNWMIARGFERYGLNETADLIRTKTIAEIEAQHERFGTFFEFYDDRQEVDPPQLLRKGQNAPQISPYHQVFHDYGWSATLYVDMIYSG